MSSDVFIGVPYQGKLVSVALSISATGVFLTDGLSL
ncbi:hypothetical protein SVI_1209 [Shewanella violacea DSS12]|uniref:Uncharacterized protein n=1 Tax=Shewanella violacea (strain JCM 10179 / CIP 106290 / LMG 19151 / DSS12) TaxID=637905 RepID=D4ZHN1_SHEVD|nr:hypothetical protein SVI_1209 [Shewanella violacea DSS12]